MFLLVFSSELGLGLVAPRGGVWRRRSSRGLQRPGEGPRKSESEMIRAMPISSCLGIMAL